MKTGLTMIFCLSLLLISNAQQQEDNFLDLTKVKPSNKGKLFGTGSGGGVGTNDTRFESLPLRITLLSLDNRSYQLGERAIYEVRLENISGTTLVIPWSPDLDKVKPDERVYPTGYMDAFLRLVIKDEVSGDESITGQGLYGSQLVPSSLKTLRPREAVTIRASGHLGFGNTDVTKRVLIKLPHTFEVRAGFSLRDRPFNSRYQPALSANSLTVELKKRQQ